MPFTEFLRSRAAALAGCLLLLGVGTLTIPRTILKLEQARSLGNGQLASLLASPSVADATRAALAIGRTRQAGGAPLLARHVNDPRPSVRAMSIYGLGVIGLGTAADQILAHTDDASGAVRIAALDALQRYAGAHTLSPAQSAAAVSATIERMLADHDPIVRGHAAIALNSYAGGASDGSIARALVQSLRYEQSPYVRQRVMWTVFRGFAKLVPAGPIEAWLSKNDEVTQIEAVRALGSKYARTKDRSALALLTTVSRTSRSWRAQEQALESIREVNGEPFSTSWTAIPPVVHVPKPRPDPLASLPVQPWPSAIASPAPPSALMADLGPPLDPTTAQEMVSPAHGPHPRLRLVTTKGNIYVVLYPEWAPLTVANFMNLSARGFYNDNRWFRIVPDFVVQTGEKDAKNTPGPGYAIGAEQNPVEQDSYVISMGLDYAGNAPKLDSAGSEYYITLSPQYHLDNAFTVFGRVVSGFDVLGRLVQSDRVIRIERVADMVL